eukprot:GHRR01010222.1.p1 GENE.GHRR01010222.1~~GHRR01010222.1.p1  ORF type:complete len:152 (+),score=61.84 GHRR01010222.1:183-638(+)
MSAADVSEIRRVLQVYDASANASVRQALGMLQGITHQAAKDPDAYDLLTDPADAKAWQSAGGESYCENIEFPNQLAARWLDVLSKPDFANAGFDKDELEELKFAMQGWVDAFSKAELGFGDADELLTKLHALIEQAPEADGDDSDDGDESD